ncbi:hypothetical protein K9L27_03765 [Candidatus Gracilibacteria bacterium]|nr:hypothetical protein [Candidatus Gracilibacteria bacterium]
MKKLYIIAFALVLCGCTNVGDHMDVEGTPVDTVGVGEMCGGIANIRCGAGLECKFDGTYPDSSGKCVETVIDKNLICEPIQAPVCGRKGDNKNGYLNECEARRHGAEIIGAGFCKPDTSVTGNCQAHVTSIGNCEAFFEGYEFDGQKCAQKNVIGCDAEIPFPSLEACQKECE